MNFKNKTCLTFNSLIKFQLSNQILAPNQMLNIHSLFLVVYDCDIIKAWTDARSERTGKIGKKEVDRESWTC